VPSHVSILRHIGGDGSRTYGKRTEEDETDDVGKGITSTGGAHDQRPQPALQRLVLDVLPYIGGMAQEPRKQPDSLAADRAYSNGPCRTYLRRRGIRHTIPEKTDSQAARLRKGSRGGRPPAFDEERYRKRNTVERAINMLKQARAVATRYDKRGYVFLGTATAAALVIWLRTCSP
jgi:transposase